MAEQPANNPEQYRLSYHEHERIFQERILPREFAGLESVTSPTVHFLGAQPGAGKSVLLGRLQHRIQQLDGVPSVLELSADNLRPYHPEYQRLREVDDEHAAFYTDRDAGRWVERAIDASFELRSHVILEGTLRRPEVTRDTAVHYRAQGFRTELHVVAIHEFVSRLRIFDRYLQQVERDGAGRYTTRAAHDVAYRALPDSLDHLASSGDFDQITLYDSFGTELVVADSANAESGERLASALAEVRQSPNLPVEMILGELDRLHVLAQRYERSECEEDIMRLRREVETTM